MRLNDIPRLYSCWLSTLIFGDKRHRYSKLLDILHVTPFRYVLDMDKNREMDGIALRYRFGHENDIPGDVVSAAGQYSVQRLGNDDRTVHQVRRADNRRH